ncbi:MAG: hypothetical protein JWN40_1434 [Phycisphaerales bacterium]|nr:hypothetical protein [Phycisphaerales bacterium]
MQSLYVDGVLQSSFTLFNPVTANTAPFIAGGYNNAGTPINAYAGLIDEIRVFDNALTPADVQSLFTNPAAVPEPAAALLIALPLACLLRRKT